MMRSNHLHRGEVFQRFVIKRKLRETETGTHYEAIHCFEANRPVSQLLLVKLFENSAVAKGRRYQAVLSRLGREHKGLPRVIDYGETPAQDFYQVSELLEGETLEEQLAHGALSPAIALEAMRQIVEALLAFGEPHLRLMPHHIFFEHSELLSFRTQSMRPEAHQLFYKDGHRELGAVRVLGFGDHLLPENQSLMKPWKPVTLGTANKNGEYVSFFPPEKSRDALLAGDVRSDVYSLGALWYYMLSGEHPFMADSFSKKVMLCMTQPFPEASERCPSLPEAHRVLLRRMTQKNPADRYPDMAALSEALMALSGEEVAQAPTRFKRGSLQRIEELPTHTLLRLRQLSEYDPLRLEPYEEGTRRAVALLRGLLRSNRTRPFWQLHPTYLLSVERDKVMVYPLALLHWVCIEAGHLSLHFSSDPHLALPAKLLDPADATHETPFRQRFMEAPVRCAIPQTMSAQELVEVVLGYASEAHESHKRKQARLSHEAELFPALLERVP